MGRSLLGVVALALLLSAGCDGGSGNNSMTKFEPGQVWTYQTREGEEASRLVVCRVEDDARLGPIVHVHVSGLRLKNKHAPRGYVEQVNHLPYAADALRRSVVKLEATGATLPAFEEGYHQWHNAFLQGKAGVWKTPLADAIAGMEAAVGQ